MQDQSPVKQKTLSLTLLLCSSFTVMAGATIAPALPTIEKVFHAHPQAELLTRLVLTIPAIFIAVGAPLVGVLLDRYGRKPVLLISLVLYALGGCSGLVADSLFGLLIGRAVLGLAVAGVMSATTTLIGDYFQGPLLQRFMGMQAAFMGYGGIVFLALGGLLAGIHWRGPFWIYAAPLVVLPAVFWSVTESHPKQLAKDHVKIPIKDLPLKTLSRIYLIALLGMLLFYILPVQVPFHLKIIGENDPMMVGFYLACINIFGATVSSQYSRLRRRFSIQSIFVLMFLLMGTGYFFIALSDSVPMLVLGLMISGTGLGMLFPNLNVWLANIAPSEWRGRLVGGMMSFIFIGQFLTPFFSQTVAAHYGIANSILAGGMVLFGLGLLFLLRGWVFRKRT